MDGKAGKINKHGSDFNFQAAYMRQAISPIVVIAAPIFQAACMRQALGTATAVSRYTFQAAYMRQALAACHS